MVSAAADRRHTVSGRTGVPWRGVPVEYGPWNRVYDFFRRWQRIGTWHRVVTRLQSLVNPWGRMRSYVPLARRRTGP
ncbi:transposase [Streptomyces chartreusis]